MFFLAVNPRVWIVLLLLFVFALARRLYRQWRQRVRDDRGPSPRVPSALREGAERTYVLFTTPLCASCGPVADLLREHAPGTRLVTIDATRQPDLADAFRVRATPTVVLADREGRVHERLVGAAAVRQHLAAAV